MSLPIKMIIDSIVQKISNEGVGIYVIHSGDSDRGDLYIKTYRGDNGFIIHHRVYDYINNKYIWEENYFENESDADNSLRTYAERDRDCWTIEIEKIGNPFKDIF